MEKQKNRKNIRISQRNKLQPIMYISYLEKAQCTILQIQNKSLIYYINMLINQYSADLLTRYNYCPRTEDHTCSDIHHYCGAAFYLVYTDNGMLEAIHKLYEEILILLINI